MDRKVVKHLRRVKSDSMAEIKNGQAVLDETGKAKRIPFDRLEYASEVGKRLGVTRRTVRKARQGVPAAIARITEKLEGVADEA
jgi:hypothetical protein